MEETKETKETKAPQVYKSITQVMAELAKVGIKKSQINKEQRYSFRGIDDVYNALAPLLASAGLVILPEVLERSVTERQTRSGSILFSVVVRVAFSFVSAVDGSAHKVITYGEAMDSGDKATNKALSAAYKYACIEAFCIPTEGDNDADASSYEVAGYITPEQALTLQALIEEVGADNDRFLKFCGAESIETIPAAKYAAAVAALEKKRGGAR